MIPIADLNRERFEKHYDDWSGSPEGFTLGHRMGDSYGLRSLSSAWVHWQAATAEYAEQQDGLPLCRNCGDQGYVHRIDGEYLGECDACPAYELLCTKRALEEARKQADDLLKAANFHVGPWKSELSRKVILDDISALRPAMYAARKKLDDESMDVQSLQDEVLSLKGQVSMLRAASGVTDIDDIDYLDTRGGNRAKRRAEAMGIDYQSAIDRIGNHRQKATK